jgi:hypothetical protein
LNNFKPWFYAAAVYNALWGAACVLAPGPLLRFYGIGNLNYPSLFQCVGMVVMVYAPGYWLVARDPERYGPFAFIGLLGKVLGPIGFLMAVWQGALPVRFGLANLTNDVIWLPAFIAFAVRYHSLSRNPRS